MAFKWIGKVTGGLLGGLVLGPIGAAFGVLLGHQFDEESEPLPPPASPAELAAIGERLFRATFHLMGYIAKADGRVSEAEIAAARAVMQELRLSEARMREAIACYSVGKQPGFDLDEELETLGRDCRDRPELTRIFLEIQMRAALGGNNLEGPVRPLLKRIAAALGASPLELLQIEALLRIQHGIFDPVAARAAAGARERELEAAYRVLETSAEASDEEVAKAYRRQLQRHHPDKLKANGLPETMLAHAQQRTQQIIAAWEIVRVRRGM
jgi:DnaJ like chaperone protein